jgi:hypothetical protein
MALCAVTTPAHNKCGSDCCPRFPYCIVTDTNVD